MKTDYHPPLIPPIEGGRIPSPLGERVRVRGCFIELGRKPNHRLCPPSGGIKAV